jgi:c-di-GMP-binding flagellar brake protein YcgR
MNLKINQRVEIIVHDEPYKGSYHSRVENYDNEQIVLAMPMTHGSLVPIRSGTLVSVVFFDELAVYEFQAPVVRLQQDNIAVLKLNLPKNIQRIQRREYVRLEVSLTVSIFVETENEGQMVLGGETADISGGGIRIILARSDFTKLTEALLVEDIAGTKLKMAVHLQSLSINKTEMVDFIGEIIRVGASGTSFWLAVNFAVISEKNRDKIVSFIFRKQLELRNKGLM